MSRRDQTDAARNVSAVGEGANTETKEVEISVSRTRKIRQLTENERQYQINLLLEKRTKMVARLRRKARAIDDLLYCSSNHLAVKQEFQQYSDLFKLLSPHHEEYCELNLNQGVFKFKHKTRSWLRDSPDKKSSEASSKGSNRNKKSSRFTKSSRSSNSSRKLKLLEEKRKNC